MSSSLDPKSLEELNALVARVKQAQKVYATFSQDKVDAIFRAAALAAADARIPLAKMAAVESGMGVAEDKVIKNHFVSINVAVKKRNDGRVDVVGIYSHISFYLRIDAQASEYIYNKYKDYKTCGIIETNEEFGTMTIAEPIGILCGIVPCTNPTVSKQTFYTMSVVANSTILNNPFLHSQRLFSRL